MARIIMLPRPRAPEGWGESESGFFELKKERLISNLSRDEQLSAQGIPSPWARVMLMKWRLEDQGTPSGSAAVSEIRRLILAQFLGYLTGEPVNLSDSGIGGFGRLCAVLRFS